jgi:hypothetical protein
MFYSLIRNGDKTLSLNNTGILGVDIGNVITRGGNEMFTPNFLQSEQMLSAFDSIQQLVEKRFGPEKVFLVSKCGANMQRKTAEWLRHHKFYELTGVREDHVHFCLERNGKAPICQKFGINIFIDDRLEVLSYLLRLPLPAVKCLLFQGKEEEIARFNTFLSSVTQVNSWKEVLRELLS